MKQYDTAVVIGRFQPVHLAHKELFEFAHSQADNVIIVIGSANQPRTFKNPFTADERARMIHASCPAIASSFKTVPNIDTPYNDQSWVTRVQQIVHDNSNPGDRVVLIGHDKDASTHYLKLFPQWDRIEFDNVANQLNASDIRDLYIKSDYNPNYIKGVVPDAVLDFLNDFSHTDDYAKIIQERQLIEDYKKQFAGLKFPPIFVTTDVVCIQSGHVLMIERKSNPGMGTLALPGGFLEQHELIIDGAMRELREETKIKVPVPVLKGSVTASRVFDYPGRSSRGRTITHAFLVELKDGPLEKVKGADDAKSAKWVPLSALDPSKIFEDHYSIIQMLVGL